MPIRSACTCPKDGAPYSNGQQYCPWCAGLIARTTDPLNRQWIGSLSEDGRTVISPHPDLRTHMPPPGATVPMKQASPYAPYKSRTEQRFAQWLAVQTPTEEIGTWDYQPIRLWLAPQTTYTADFVVQRGEQDALQFEPGVSILLTPTLAVQLLPPPFSALTFYETKASTGHVYEASRAYDKLKVAAHLYPCFTFRLAQWDRPRAMWYIRTIPA